VRWHQGASKTLQLLRYPDAIQKEVMLLVNPRAVPARLQGILPVKAFEDRVPGRASAYSGGQLQ
jgi:hypothetical protein